MPKATILLLGASGLIGSAVAARLRPPRLGASTAAAIRELRLARETIFADGEDRDAPVEGRP